jgi:hypothetical protein
MDYNPKFKKRRSYRKRGIYWLTTTMKGKSKQVLLKGQSHEIFDLWFFSSSIPLGPLIYGLKRF